jgi:hypothetical protein
MARAHLSVLVVLELVMGVSLVLLALRGDWAQAAFVGGIMAVCLVPTLSRRMSVEIPSEVSLAAVLFVFASLFLGEVHHWYELYPWWDAALHTTSGLLLGLLGFINDPSGLTDTMQDLIVDTIGAAVVSLWGWRYLRRPRASRIDSWAARFMARHPRVFGD